MQAVILAGGRGTRLRPYTTVVPKPLVPIGSYPILELIVRQLADCGFATIDLCLGHLGELIEAYLEQSSGIPDGMELRYHREKEPLGTAGALRLVEPSGGPFLVMNGDILTTLDYGALMAHHREQEASLTIATHHQDVKLELGVIEGSNGAVTGYVEKPLLKYEVSMGIYVYEPSTVDCIPEGHFDFPDVVHALLGLEKRVCTYHFNGPWYDIGTPDQHELANTAFESEPDLFLNETVAGGVQRGG